MAAPALFLHDRSTLQPWQAAHLLIVCVCCGPLLGCLPACMPACSTNSSYDRWWEARKLWGGVVNRSRDIVRQVGAELAAGCWHLSGCPQQGSRAGKAAPLQRRPSTTLDHSGLFYPPTWVLLQGLVFFREEDAHLRELLATWASVFPWVLMCHLRENMDVSKEVAVSGRGVGCGWGGERGAEGLPAASAGCCAVELWEMSAGTRAAAVATARLSTHWQGSPPTSLGCIPAALAAAPRRGGAVRLGPPPQLCDPGKNGRHTSPPAALLFCVPRPPPVPVPSLCPLPLAVPPLPHSRTLPLGAFSTH